LLVGNVFPAWPVVCCEMLVQVFCFVNTIIWAIDTLWQVVWNKKRQPATTPA